MQVTCQCLSVCLSVYTHLSVCPSVCLSIYLSIYLFVCLPVAVTTMTTKTTTNMKTHDVAVTWKHTISGASNIYFWNFCSILFNIYSTFIHHSPSLLRHVRCKLPASVYLSVCLSVCMSVYTHLSVCPSVHLSVCLSIYLSICLSICLPACGSNNDDDEDDYKHENTRRSCNMKTHDERSKQHLFLKLLFNFVQ